MNYSSFFDNIFEAEVLKTALQICGIHLPYSQSNFSPYSTKSFIKVNEVRLSDIAPNQIDVKDICRINQNLEDSELSTNVYCLCDLNGNHSHEVKEMSTAPHNEKRSKTTAINADTYKQLNRIAKKENQNVTKEEIYEKLLLPYNHEKVKVWSSELNRHIISYIWRYGDCNKEFTKTWNLLDHVRMHEGIKPFKCKEWSKTFTQKGNLKKHLLIQHSNVPLKERKKYKCEYCTKSYTERYNLLVSRIAILI